MANSVMRNTGGFGPSMNPGMNPNQLAQRGGMSMPQMIQQIKRFGSAFKGDPKQQVMSMVQQGMRSNEQLQQAMQMAKQFEGMFN